MPNTVLVIASPFVANRVFRGSRGAGLEFVFAPDVMEGLLANTEYDPDLVVIEVAADDFPLADVCGRIREHADIPILVLALSAEPAVAVQALEAGADDCLPASVSERELIARIRAWLRRFITYASVDDPRQLTVGALSIDIARHEVTMAGERVELTPKEFDLLVALARRPGAVVRRSELIDEVWGDTAKRRSRTLDVHIGRLRSKLEQDPQHPRLIVTVAGVGYRMEAPEEIAA